MYFPLPLTKSNFLRSIPKKHQFFINIVIHTTYMRVVAKALARKNKYEKKFAKQKSNPTNNNECFNTTSVLKVEKT